MPQRNLPARLALVFLLVGSVWLAGCCNLPSCGGRPSLSSVSATPAATPAVVVNPPFLQDGAILPISSNDLARIERRAEALARFANASSLDQRSEMDSALENYFLAAETDPANEGLVMDLSLLLLQRKEYSRAISLISKATNSPGAPSMLFTRLGMALLQTGQTNQSMAMQREAIRRAPKVIGNYQTLYLLHMHQGRFLEALPVIEEAFRVPEVEALFLLELSEMYVQYGQQVPAGNWKPRAVECLRRALATKPTIPLLLMKLADGFNYLGETASASDLYLKMLAQFSGNNVVQSALRQKLVDLYLRGKDRRRATEQLEAIARENPTNPQTYYILGGLAFEERNFPRAIEYFNKAVLLNPDFELGYHDIATAQINANQPDDALQTIQKAEARFGPNHFTREYLRSLAYNRKKDYAQALKALTAAEIIARATETNRLNEIFYFQLGATYERQKNFAEAERYFEKCLELEPNFAEALNYLGYMWAERGVNLPKAKTYIEKAVKLEPKNSAFLDSLGWVYYQMDRPQEALKHILKSVELSEEPDATLYDHLGDVYAKLKNREKAREAWQKSLQIEPSDAVRKKLESFK